MSERPVVTAVRYCCQPQHLRRTVTIALIVGVVLTTINQLDVVLDGEATSLTAVKAAMNFVVPFIVSNVGLLSGRNSRPQAAPDEHAASRKSPPVRDRR